MMTMMMMMMMTKEEEEDNHVYDDDEKDGKAMKGRIKFFCLAKLLPCLLLVLCTWVIKIIINIIFITVKMDMAVRLVIMAMTYTGCPKKCPLAIFGLNLFQKSDLTFSHVFHEIFDFDWNCGGKSTACILVFFGHLIFLMIKLFRWIGLKILILKHMWKSVIGLLEQL